MATYTIPYFNLVTVKNMIMKFNNKSGKLGTSAITISDGGPYYKKFENGWMAMVDINVEGNVPLIKGWAMVAMVDHTNAGNVINKFPSYRDVVLPEEFYTRAPFCDHCNTRRVKVHSVIIKNVETGEYMHVGRTCLNDFFGEDISSIIHKLSFIKELSDNMENGEYSTGGIYEYHCEEVMEVAMCAIRQWGYRKSSDENSTKDAIASYYSKGRKLFEINEKDIADAKNAIEWVRNNTSNNEFFINVKTIINNVYIAGKYFGYIAGAAVSYLKEIDRKNTEMITFKDEYVGSVGVRDTFTVKLIAKKAIESYYGVSYLHIFTDNKGHKLSWFASRDTDTDINSEYVIKGTVKKHEVYNNMKQTALTRVTVMM